MPEKNWYVTKHGHTISNSLYSLIVTRYHRKDRQRPFPERYLLRRNPVFRRLPSRQQIIGFHLWLVAAGPSRATGARAAKSRANALGGGGRSQTGAHRRKHSASSDPARRNLRAIHFSCGTGQPPLCTRVMSPLGRSPSDWGTRLRGTARREKLGGLTRL